MTDLDRAARLLFDLRSASRTVARLPDDCQPEDLAEAYAIQDRIAALSRQPTVAWKVGATNAATRERLGVAAPFWGRYQADDVMEYPAVLGWERFATRPGIEVEVGLRLGRALEGPCSPAEAAQAVAEVVPTIEVVCSRLADPFAAGGLAVVADNGMADYLILGEPIPLAQAGDLSKVGAVLRVDGDEVARGSAAEAGVDPLAVLAWLANELAGRERRLEAGDVVSTGTLTGVYWASPTNGLLADLGKLGRLSMLVSD